MRVLFISAWFPYPPDNGARIRTYNLIKALAEKHEVHLVSLLQEDSRREDAWRLADICEVVSLHESHWFKPGSVKSLAGFFSSKPRSVVDTYDPKVKEAVNDAIARLSPDAVVASTLGAVEYVPRGLAIPTILEEHNCEYAVMKRAAEDATGTLNRLRCAAGWRKSARYEADACRRFDAVTMVSEEDRERILDVAPDLANVHVVPNGVDTERYSPESWDPEPNTLIYNGALTYGANLDAVRHFAEDIYPILGNAVPDVKLHVTGRARPVIPNEREESAFRVSETADFSQARNDVIDGCPGIELTGYVEDIRDTLSASAACVVPLRQGGGTRLKILEAMAAGVPVVATSVGAEGIDAIHGEHLLIADLPADFAEAVRLVLTDHALAGRLRRRARTLVEDRYSWSVIGRAFVEIVESL